MQLAHGLAREIREIEDNMKNLENIDIFCEELVKWLDDKHPNWSNKQKMIWGLRHANLLRECFSEWVSKTNNAIDAF